MGDMDPHIFAVAEEAYKQMARLVEALFINSRLLLDVIISSLLSCSILKYSEWQLANYY